jgi:hypothetical protein
MPDLEGDRFVAELKCRDRLPGVIRRAFGELERALLPGDRRIRLVILHENGGRLSDDVVCVRLGEFRRLLGLAAEEASLPVDADSSG